MINPHIKIGVLAESLFAYGKFVENFDRLDRDTFVYISSADDLVGIKLDTAIRLKCAGGNKSYDTRFFAYLKAALKDQNVAAELHLVTQPEREKYFPNFLDSLRGMLIPEDKVIPR